MIPIRSIAVALLGMLWCTAGCSTSAPRIGHPTSIDSNCGTMEARMTGVDSVLTSTDDKIVDDRPKLADIIRTVHTGDGIVAYWDAQPLALPNIAQQFGETDGYVRINAAAVAPTADLATTRTLYLNARDHGKYRWIALTAYDTQNVCVEGHRDV